MMDCMQHPVPGSRVPRPGGPGDSRQYHDQFHRALTSDAKSIEIDLKPAHGPANPPGIGEARIHCWPAMALDTVTSRPALV